MSLDSRAQPSARLTVRLLVAAATLVASIWLIYWIARREGVTIDWHEMNFIALAGAAGVMVAAWGVDALRIQWLAAGVGGRIAFRAALRTVLAGYFVANVTPFLAGGAPVQVYSLLRAGLPLAEASAVIVAGGVLAQATLVVAALVVLLGGVPGPETVPWLGQAMLVATVAYGVALGALVWALPRLDVARRLVSAGFGAAGALFGHRRGERWEARTLAFVERLAESFALLFQRRPGRLVVAVLLYALFFLAVFSVAPIIAYGLGLDVPLSTLVAVQVPFFLLLTLAPTPGGTGAAEYGLFALFEGLVPAAGLGLLVSGVRAITFYLNLTAGAVSLTLMTLQGRAAESLPNAR